MQAALNTMLSRSRVTPILTSYSRRAMIVAMMTAHMVSVNGHHMMASDGMVPMMRSSLRDGGETA